MNNGNLDRYARQFRYPPLGEEGQRRLMAARVLLCGCGVLGTVLAGTLARAGVGLLRIVDRDFVELNNLQRQVLFEEADAEAGTPKAVAAAAAIGRINSQVRVEPHVADLDAGNVLAMCQGVDLILDGTDNFDTRYLLNEAAVKLGIPWVYGGCVGAEGQTMTILPGETPCLRCVVPEPPPPAMTPTCDTAGILAPLVNVIASLQAMEALKILSGNRQAVSRSLTVVELWDNRIRTIDVRRASEGRECPTCVRGEFPWLARERGGHTAVLCGRNAVQLSQGGSPVSLDDLSQKLAGIGPLTRNPYLLRLSVDGYQLTVFADGRAIISGTDDPAVAKSLYARYVGN